MEVKETRYAEQINLGKDDELLVLVAVGLIINEEKCQIRLALTTDESQTQEFNEDFLPGELAYWIITIEKIIYDGKPRLRILRNKNYQPNVDIQKLSNYFEKYESYISRDFIGQVSTL